MITQYAYAKSIPGGFQIVSMHHQPYVVPELPKQCSKTRLPILVVPEAAERIIRIQERGMQKLQLLLHSLRKPLSEFMAGIDEDQRIANSVPESRYHEDEALASMFAACGLFGAVADELRPWDNLRKDLTPRVEGTMNELGISAAQEAGYQVTVTQKQTLLDLLIVRLEEECNDPQCEVHGQQVQITPNSVRVEEEEDSDIVEIGGEG